MSAGTMTEQIREHMDVVCSNGGKIGVVDHVEGDRIKLTKNDAKDHKHHYIPVSLVRQVDSQVRLSIPGDQVMRQWQTE